MPEGVQYLVAGPLCGVGSALDWLFTPPAFLRKMASSHAALSPEGRCFVRRISTGPKGIEYLICSELSEQRSQPRGIGTGNVVSYPAHVHLAKVAGRNKQVEQRRTAGEVEVHVIRRDLDRKSVV